MLLPCLPRDQDIIREYFAGGGLDEAARRVREIAAPHFHHEVVFRALQWAVDHAPNPLAETALISLLQHLETSQAAGMGPLVSPTQVEEGFRRVQERLSDISLDAPSAPAVLARLSEAARAQGLIGSLSVTR